MSCMQNDKGNFTLGVNWEEVTDLMVIAMKTIRALVDAHPEVFPNGYADIKIMMDNATWNKKALEMGLAAKCNLSPKQFLWHPANSPDLQAPIEQSWSSLVHTAQTVVAQNTKDYTEAGLKIMLSRLWNSGGTDEHGNKCALISDKTARGMVRRLIQNCAVIKQKGGDWGNHKLG